jgi:hypothetical protein
MNEWDLAELAWRFDGHRMSTIVKEFGWRCEWRPSWRQDGYQNLKNSGHIFGRRNQTNWDDAWSFLYKNIFVERRTNLINRLRGPVGCVKGVILMRIVVACHLTEIVPCKLGILDISMVCDTKELFSVTCRGKFVKEKYWNCPNLQNSRAPFHPR